MKMETVLSPDGTCIAFARSGAGPPLVLIQGTGAASPAAWSGVFPALEQRFSVFTLDRRGRGASGDNPSYALEREYEDIAALLDTIGEPAALLGHSFGAILALEAALLVPNLRCLVLYEPPLPLPGRPQFPAGAVDRLLALLEAGDRERVLVAHYRDNVKMPPGEIELLRTSPGWPARLAAAHTLPREMRALERYTFDPLRFKDLAAPALLLRGEASPPASREALERISSALQDSRTAILAGQGRLAMYTAPDLFLRTVLAFLQSPV